MWAIHIKQCVCGFDVSQNNSEYTLGENDDEV